jgi:outer membrane immunogenic protein
MRKLAIAAAALAVSGSAYAADMPLLKAPPKAAAPPSWSGFYIGVNGGYDWGHTDTGLVISGGGFFAGTAGPATIQSSSNQIQNSGGLAGGQVGYLLQLGSVVAGIEGSFDWFRAKGSASVTSLNIPAAGNTIAINETADAQWLALVTARVGYDLGAWYPYLTGGMAVASLKYTHSYLDNIPPAFASNASLTQTQQGVTGGGGIEYRFDGHWSLRGEYLYIRFNDVNGSVPVINTTTGLPTGNTFAHKATFTENIGRAALSYKF